MMNKKKRKNTYSHSERPFSLPMFLGPPRPVLACLTFRFLGFAFPSDGALGEGDFSGSAILTCRNGWWMNKEREKSIEVAKVMFHERIQLVGQ